MTNDIDAAHAEIGKLRLELRLLRAELEDLKRDRDWWHETAVQRGRVMFTPQTSAGMEAALRASLERVK